MASKSIEKIKKTLSLSGITISDNNGEITITKASRGKVIEINRIYDIRPKRLQDKAVKYIQFLNCDRYLAPDNRCLCGFVENHNHKR